MFNAADKVLRTLLCSVGSSGIEPSLCFLQMCTQGSSGDGSSTWFLVTHVGDLDGCGHLASASSDVVVEGIWGSKPGWKIFLCSLSVCL